MSEGDDNYIKLIENGLSDYITTNYRNIYFQLKDLNGYAVFNTEKRLLFAL